MTTATAVDLRAELDETRWTRRFILPEGDRPVVAKPDYRGADFRQWVMILDATTNGSGQPVPENAVGTIHYSYRQGDMYRVSDFPNMDRSSNTIDVVAALVNPEPQHRHWYREFSFTGALGRLLRYDITQEKFEVKAWSTGLRRNDSADPVHVDHADLNVYVEVQEPDVQLPLQEPDVQLPLQEAEGSEVRPPAQRGFLGKAKTNSVGLVDMNPTLADGDVFVWSPIDSGEQEYAWLAMIDHGQAMGLGYWNSATGTYIDHTHITPAPSQRVWARYAAPEHTMMVTWDELHTHVSRIAGQAERAFQDFDQEMGKLAVEKGCCGDYEAITGPLGMSPKPEPEDPERDWDVQVCGSFTVDLSSIPSTVDTALDEYYGNVGFSVGGTVTVTSDFEFTFRVADERTEEAVREYVNQEVVQSELDGLLNHYATGVTVKHYRIDEIDPV